MTSSPKRKRILPVRDILKGEEITPEFKVIDGLRYVVPYHFKFRVYAKKRWFDRSVLEVFTEEFQAYTSDYYRSALSSGKITVDSKIVPPDYKLKDHDFLTHCIHRHEPPVLDANIDTITETDEILAVNKPASFPVHTTGRFQHNTLLKTLELKLQYKLYTCHRLDRLTSGIIVLLKKPEKAKQFAALFRDHAVKKTYLCLCSGEFPSAGLTCSEPIQRVCHKLGICAVNRELGKPSHTTFTRLHYDSVTNRSLLLCAPTTGRMHQIRVHLAHHGHPIPNDPIYARENWAKKSTPEFSKELSNALFATDNVTDIVGNGNGTTTPTNISENNNTANKSGLSVSGDGIKSTSDISVTPNGDFLLAGKTYKTIPQLSVDAVCPECRVTRLAPHKQDMFIYLHAVRYELDGNIFTSQLPEWCRDEWIPDSFREFLALV